MSDFNYQCQKCGIIKDDELFEPTGRSEICLECEKCNYCGDDEDGTTTNNLCDECTEVLAEKGGL